MLFLMHDRNIIRDLEFDIILPLSDILIEFLNLDITLWNRDYIVSKKEDYHKTYLKYLMKGNIRRDKYIKFRLNELIGNKFLLPTELELEKERIKKELNIDEENFFEKFPILTRNNDLSFSQYDLGRIKDVMIYITELTLIDKNSFVDANFDISHYLDRKVTYSIEMDSSGNLLEKYFFETIDSFCLFVLAKLYNTDFIIKRCVNCGDFFVPTVRSDEVYCDKVHPNGRTCKQMGYENKIKSDDILREYRKVYKSKNAIKIKLNNNSADQKWNTWKKYAKFKLKACQDGKITLDEFTDWLKNS